MFGRKPGASALADVARTPKASMSQASVSQASVSQTPTAPEQPLREQLLREHRGQAAADETYIAQGDSQRHEMRSLVLSRLDPMQVTQMERGELTEHIEQWIHRLADQHRWLLTADQQAALLQELLDDMIGVGPIQSLLDDPQVTDIMVNGHAQVYVERAGHLQPVDHCFRDENHVRHVAQRIASSVGRRVDESSPMVDARLLDGSRVNIIIPPLALDGTCISIRKFSDQTFSLHQLAAKGSLSEAMADFLNIAAKARLNILVSGGTGAGKTTLLNALSHPIDPDERIVTIEDAAELKLRQRQVIRLETRPASLEGEGAISQTELVKNALRMNPRRIILGEVRGGEAFDMLQAMNTGHEGSMSTLHANSPRDAIYRLENMMLMAHGNLPIAVLRRQIMSSVDIIVQIERMRDGTRRVTSITELVGLEDDTPITHELFAFKLQAVGQDGIDGEYCCSATSSESFIDKIRYAGLEDALQQCQRQTR
ncbi:CpaF family protein [Bacterioplanoides sp.]|uniref:CpaF family protein n=1 Tax=Bacterioplanoides sp. TaxID=2066072 RepID=UPI003B001F7F